MNQFGRAFFFFSLLRFRIGMCSSFSIPHTLGTFIGWIFISNQKIQFQIDCHVNFHTYATECIIIRAWWSMTIMMMMFNFVVVNSNFCFLICGQLLYLFAWNATRLLWQFVQLICFFFFLMTFCWVISIFLFPWPLQVNSSDQKVHFLVNFENGTPFHCSFSIDGWCLPTLTGRYEITVSSTQYTGNSYSLFRQWIGCQIRRSIRTQSHISVAAMTKQMTLSLDNNMLWIFFPKIKN